MFLLGKSGCIDKEEKRGGEIDKESDDDPEVFRIEHVKNGRIFYLLVKEENTVNDDKNGFQGGGKGVKTGCSFTKKGIKRYPVKQQGA
jgi:hypothetical protein